jgi:hypothetical protein
MWKEAVKQAPEQYMESSKILFSQCPDGNRSGYVPNERQTHYRCAILLYATNMLVSGF